MLATGKHLAPYTYLPWVLVVTKLVDFAITVSAASNTLVVSKVSSYLLTERLAGGTRSIKLAYICTSSNYNIYTT